MNNTTRTLAIAAILAATLVVGGMLATTTTQAAYAYKKDNGKGNGNGNTVTIQKCKQLASESGFDNSQEQECANLICTHPGENATCVEEGAAPTPTPTPIKKTCIECFTKFLTPQQITALIADVPGDVTSLPGLCNALERQFLSEAELRDALTTAQVSTTIANELIACLLQAGIVFPV